MNIVTRFLLSWAVSVIAQFLFREIHSDFQPFAFTHQFFMDTLWLGGINFALQVLWSLFWIEKQLRKPSVSLQLELRQAIAKQSAA